LPNKKTTGTACFYTDKAIADQNLDEIFNSYYKKHNIKQTTVVLQGKWTKL